MQAGPYNKVENYLNEGSLMVSLKLTERILSQDNFTTSVPPQKYLLFRLHSKKISKFYRSNLI